MQTRVDVHGNLNHAGVLMGTYRALSSPRAEQARGMTRLCDCSPETQYSVLPEMVTQQGWHAHRKKLKVIL
jgi:hypothetical protein